MSDTKQQLNSLVEQLRKEPDNAKAHYDLGNLLLESTNKIQESVVLLVKAVELSKGHHDAFNALGNSLRINGRFKEAELSYMHALMGAHTPERPLANFSSYWAELGQFEQAGLFAYLSKMVNSQFPQANWLLAMHHLRHNNYQDGWPLIAKRAELDAKAVGINDKSLPIWQGNYVPLLLQKEQGVGDFIQYVRFIPQLAAKVPRLVVQIPAGMRELCSFNFPNVVLTEDTTEACAKGLSARIPMFDLHRVLDIAPNMPVASPYLRAPERGSHLIHPSAEYPRPWVGVVWSGNPMHKNDRNRSIAASEFVQIFNKNGAEKFKGTVISLQKKPAKEDMASSEAFKYLDVSAHLNSWLDTAQALLQLDYLVSVDTSVAHLGAAMGVSTHILVPRSPDWRWGLHSSKTFWYPKVTIHRQDEQASWTKALNNISLLLK